LRRDLVRPRNTKAPFVVADISREEVPIPTELLDWVASEPAEMAPLYDMRQRLISLRVDVDKSAMIIVSSPSELEMARGIAEHIFSSRKKLLDLERDIDSKEERVRRRKDEEKQSIRADFDIHPLLIGYLYGSKRANVSKENLPAEITSVRVERNHCTIFGKTQEAVDQTEERLHIIAKKVLLSSSETWFLVGSKGKDIKQMTDHVGVMRLITKRRWQQELETLKERASSQGKDSRSRRGRRSRGSSPTKDRDEDSEPLSFTDLFTEANTIDMTNGKEPDDFLVIIGRRAEVRLCETMIEMTINAVRKIAETRDRVYKLRDRIAEQKGYSSRPRRDRGGRRKGGGGRRRDEDGDRGSPKGKGKGRGAGKKGKKDDRGGEKKSDGKGKQRRRSGKGGKGSRDSAERSGSSTSEHSGDETRPKRGGGRTRYKRTEEAGEEDTRDSAVDTKTHSGDEKPPRDTEKTTGGRRRRRRRRKAGSIESTTPA